MTADQVYSRTHWPDVHLPMELIVTELHVDRVYHEFLHELHRIWVGSWAQPMEQPPIVLFENCEEKHRDFFCYFLLRFFFSSLVFFSFSIIAFLFCSFCLCTISIWIECKELEIIICSFILFNLICQRHRWDNRAFRIF